MAMNPRTHPRGAPPDFNMDGLPPVPKYTTPALWWLVQMRLRLEPLSENGGTFANKRQYHNTGQNLLDHRDENGNRDWANDPSIRRAPDRSGPWWRQYSSAHDWTFDRAHTGNYTEIKKYCNRLRNAMRDPDDLRPDNVYAYFIGQIDDDRVVEGYNEYEDDDETGDITHLWHRHDSFRRNIIGSFAHMWMALTIDMGWTYAEWQRSVAPPPPVKEWSDMASEAEIKAAFRDVLEESHRLPGGPGLRLHKPKAEGGPGWGEMSDRLIAAYAFETLLSLSEVLSAFIAYEKAEDTGEAGGDTARSEALARLEAASARIEALVQDPSPEA